MIDIESMVLWTNRNTKEVMIWTHAEGAPGRRPGRGSWSDPIGAAYTQWRKMTNRQRVQLMLETAIDLTMQGYSLKTILMLFAQVPEFRALGGQSFPMCRALTKALVGRSLEPNTMNFEDLLMHHASEVTQ
jgi:hypothetical protein